MADNQAKRDDYNLDEIQFYEANDKEILYAAAAKEKADALFYQRLEIKTQTATSTHGNRL